MKIILKNLIESKQFINNICILFYFYRSISQLEPIIENKKIKRLLLNKWWIYFRISTLANLGEKESHNRTEKY